jgi:hypothetical protein
MVWMMVVFTLGAAAAVAGSVGVVILGLQWFTTYPFRWGWRAHPEPIGVQRPNGDPRLETKPRRGHISLASKLTERE